MNCINGCVSGMVSVLVPCPECKSPLGLTLASKSLGMYHMLKQWATTPAGGAKMASLRMRTEKLLNDIEEAKLK